MLVWARCEQEIDSKQQISSTRAAGPLHQDDAAVTTRAATGLVGWLEKSLMPHYTVSQKKQDTKLLPITLPNIGQFSKFFHC